LGNGGSGSALAPAFQDHGQLELRRSADGNALRVRHLPPADFARAIRWRRTDPPAGPRANPRGKVGAPEWSYRGHIGDNIVIGVAYDRRSLAMEVSTANKLRLWSAGPGSLPPISPSFKPPRLHPGGSAEDAVGNVFSKVTLVPNDEDGQRQTAAEPLSPQSLRMREAAPPGHVRIPQRARGLAFGGLSTQIRRFSLERHPTRPSPWWADAACFDDESTTWTAGHPPGQSPTRPAQLITNPPCYPRRWKLGSGICSSGAPANCKDHYESTAAFCAWFRIPLPRPTGLLRGMS